MARNQGGRGAVRELAAETAAAIAQADAERESRQLSLLAPTRFDGQRAAEQRRKIASDATRARGVGRPKGSENVATKELKEFLRAHGYDPVIARWRWLLHTPETLASELGCTKLEAFDRIDRINAELRKLFYADAPMLDDQGKPLPTFSLTIGGENVAVQVNQGGQVPAQIPPWETDAEVTASRRKIEAKQAVTIEAEAKSQAGKSQTSGKGR
jgi:hypothetical protein